MSSSPPVSPDRTTPRRLTLSFDNGPDADTTPRVLDVLGRRGLKATFFVIGRKLADPAGRKLAERAKAEGHWIGNHTWNHATPLGLLSDPEAPAREIGATQDELGDLVHPDRWFRPFGGGGKLGPHLLSPGARDHLIDGGYSCVLWNSVPGDWEDHDGWTDRAAAEIRAQDWTLLVLHDYVAPAMRNLDSFLAGRIDEGVRFAQEFPPDCVPIRRGQVLSPLEGFVAGAAAS